jgi:hypothetical protein
MISGDAGLLELAGSYPILPPAKFLGHIRGGK